MSIIPMYQIIAVLVLNTIIAYNKEKHEYNFDILFVFSIFFFGTFIFVVPNP